KTTTPRNGRKLGEENSHSSTQNESLRAHLAYSLCVELAVELSLERSKLFGDRIACRAETPEHLFPRDARIATRGIGDRPVQTFCFAEKRRAYSFRAQRYDHRHARRVDVLHGFRVVARQVDVELAHHFDSVGVDHAGLAARALHRHALTEQAPRQAF